MRAFLATLLLLALPLSAMAQQPTPAQPPPSDQPPASQVTPDSWPKTTQVSNVNYTLYQPQLDKWDGYVFEAHAAVSVQPPDAKEPIFGVIEISAVTNVDKQASTVYFEGIQITKATFPSAPSQAPVYQKAIQEILEVLVHGLGRPEAHHSDRSLGSAIAGNRKTGKTPRFERERPNQGYTLGCSCRFPQIRLAVAQSGLVYKDETLFHVRPIYDFSLRVGSARLPRQICLLLGFLLGNVMNAFA
jgi:hypothetical protein